MAHDVIGNSLRNKDHKRDGEEVAQLLTRNQKLVLTALEKTRAPQSAYDLLDRLRSKGIRAPLQVYRALDKLIENGLAHRLESLNAFVSCQRTRCCERDQVVFAICTQCGKAEEIAAQQLLEKLLADIKRSGFVVGHSMVELKGTCSDCASQ